MTYHWKTIVQDVLSDYDIQESLDDDITEICQKGGWEVWQIDIIHWTESISKIRPEHIVQRIVTLRSSETVGEKLQPGDIPITQNAWVEMHALRAEIARWENTNAAVQSNADAYGSAVTRFYQRVSAILGL